MCTNELHEALLRKHNTDFWKGWRSKFESVNECKQVEGCVDADVIVGKFCDFFVKSCACNNARRADELRQEYVVLRQNYGGFPIIDNDHFDTEMVSKIIF